MFYQYDLYDLFPDILQVYSNIVPNLKTGLKQINTAHFSRFSTLSGNSMIYSTIMQHWIKVPSSLTFTQMIQQFYVYLHFSISCSVSKVIHA